MTTPHPQQPVCPACSSLSIRYRVTLGSYVCNRCGKTWDKPPQPRKDN